MKDVKFLERWFGKPTMSKFAQGLLAALKQSGDDRKLRYDSDEDRLVEEDGAGVINLTNLFHDYCQLDRECRDQYLRQTAESFVQAHDDLPSDYNVVRKDLRPKVWSRAAIDHLELQARLQGGAAPDMPVYPLGDHLYSSIVYDLPSSMRSLTGEQLEIWGVNYYEALEESRHNLQQATVCWSTLGDTMHSSISGDSYDSSRLLLLDRINELDVVGDPVAVVPNRDTLLVCGTEDEQALMIMLSLTQQATEDEPRPLSPLPMRLVEGEWESWMPPSGHPAFDGFRELETQFLGELYAKHKELVDAIHEKEGIDIFVASFSGMRAAEDGPVRSYCVWPRGCDALLPQTQFVALVSDDGVEASGPWQRVYEAAGDLMIVDETCYPKRYRVREFPSKEALQAIGTEEMFS